MSDAQFSQIKVYAALFEKDTNGDFILDQNGNKIVIKNYTTVRSKDDYSVVTEIKESYLEE